MSLLRPGVRPPAWLPPAAVAAAVVVFALVPTLRTPSFYFWDDSAAVFLPTWRAIGTDLLAGHWPTMRPDFWMGGNWAGEAQFGLWNPVNLLLAVVVALTSDLAVAAAAVKIFFLVALAVGAYALAVDYGATPWVAAGVAVAVPFGGFTLYYDAASWAAGLMAFAWMPWFWWAARRMARGHLNPGLAFVVGYLLITNGSPAGALAAVVVLAGVASEAALTGNRAGLGRLVVLGACVGTAAGVAYLPLWLSAGSGWRGTGILDNDGMLVPDLTMIAASSSPSMLPFIRTWSDWGTTVPMTYSAWFLTPILPWLAWDVLRRRARDIAGLGVILAAFLALTLGPSVLWLFRWPVRFLEYVVLVVLVAVGVLLSAGFRASAWRTRAVVTALIVAAGTWLTFAADADRDLLGKYLAGAVLWSVLVGAMVTAGLRAPRFVPAVLAVGTGVVLVVQTGWSPANRDVAVWQFPTAAAELDAWADRYQGPMVQVASVTLVTDAERPAAWDDLLFGSMPAGGAGVESTTAYSGLGHAAFAETLCMTWDGATCPDAFTAAFAPAGDAVRVPHLVDALEAQTVVVQNALVPGAAAAGAPAGWEVAEVTDRVTVFRRSDGQVAWPDSRLAAVSPGVEVLSAAGTATREALRVSTGADGGALLFSRLAWPGYTAAVDGQDTEVEANTQGLIEVPLPAGVTDAAVTLRFDVPGYEVAIPLLVLGVAGAGVQAAAWERARRRGASRATGAARGAP